MGTAEVAKKNLEIAHQSPDIGKRGLGKVTKTKEELRQEFMGDMGKELKTITKLLKVFIKRLDKQELISNADIKTLMDLLSQIIGSPEKDKSGDTNILMTGKPVLILGGLTQIKENE